MDSPKSEKQAAAVLKQIFTTAAFPLHIVPTHL